MKRVNEVFTSFHLSLILVLLAIVMVFSGFTSFAAGERRFEVEVSEQANGMLITKYVDRITGEVDTYMLTMFSEDDVALNIMYSEGKMGMSIYSNCAFATKEDPNYDASWVDMVFKFDKKEAITPHDSLDFVAVTPQAAGFAGVESDAMWMVGKMKENSEMYVIYRCQSESGSTHLVVAEFNLGDFPEVIARVEQLERERRK
jgi:hypothetical protein